MGNKMKLNSDHQYMLIHLLGLFGVIYLVISYIVCNEFILVGLSIATITWIILGVNKLLIDFN